MLPIRRAIAQSQSSTLRKGGASPKLTDEQKEVLRAYVKARRAESAAGKIVQKHKDAVLSIARLMGGRVVALQGVMFVGQSISYEYQSSVKKKQAALKTMKDLMQLDGRARQVSKECLMFEDLLAKQNASSDETTK